MEWSKEQILCTTHQYSAFQRNNVILQVLEQYKDIYLKVILCNHEAVKTNSTLGILTPSCMRSLSKLLSQSM
jgi:hypothetical protein